MIEQKRVLRHEKTIRAALLPPLLAMVGLATFLGVLVFYLLNTTRLVTHSAEVAYSVSRTMRLAVDMETGKRGFLLGGDPVFLAPYDAAGKRIDASFDELAALVRDNPAQAKRVALMRTRFNTWRTGTEGELARYRNAPPKAFAGTFDDRRGKVQMDDVRVPFEELLDAEKRLQKERGDAAAGAVRLALFAGGAATLGLGVLLAAATRRHLRQLGDEYEVALESEARVRERLATTLTSIGDGVLVTDATGAITLMNPVTEAMTGWTSEEARGKPHTLIFDIYNEGTGEPVPSPVEEVLRENRTVMLANHTVLQRRDGSQVAIEDSAAPIRGKDGTVTGVVLVFRDVTERKAQDAQLAEALSRNTRIAETLQRSMLLLPAKSAFPGVSLVTVYEPARDEALVGGDFFDVFSFWDNKVAFVVGDATGKGLEAAATTSEVKYALRAFLHNNANPGDALTRLNRFLIDARTDSDTAEAFVPPAFVSVAVALLDTATGELICAVAGAEAPLIVRQNGDAVEAGESNTMLGASPESVYTQIRTTVERGAVLAMVTDGVTEARRGRREFFGYEGFTRSVQRAYQAPGTPLETVAQTVVSDAKAYAGGRLHDDVCLLVARRE